MQIIPYIYTDAKTNTIASAQPCVLFKWIPYATIAFNGFYFNQVPNDLFHFNVIAIVILLLNIESLTSS